MKSFEEGQTQTASPELSNLLSSTPNEAKTAKVEPAKTEPAKVEPVAKTEPVEKVEPVTKVEPIAEVVKTEQPAKTEAEPAKTEPATKAWWVEDEPAKNTTPVESKEAFAEIENKAKTLDGLVANPQMKYVLDAFAEGKTLIDIANAIRVIDYSKLSPDDVVRAYGQLREWKDDQIEETIVSINDMPVYQREEMLENWQAKLTSNQGNPLAKLIHETSERHAENEKQELFIRETLDKELSEEMQFIVGKEYFGAILNENDAKDFETFVRSGFDFQRPNGTYDIKRMLKFWLGEKKMHTIKKVNQAIGEAVATEKALNEIARPNAQSSAAVTQVPQTAERKKPSEGAMDTAKKLASGQLQPSN